MLNMIDEDAEGVTMILEYAAAALQNFSGKTPFTNPRTGRTVNPQPLPSHLYKEIARVHTKLGEILFKENVE